MYIFAATAAMGRTKFSEAGPKRTGRHVKSSAALAAKSGFDGLTEAPWRKTPSIFQQPVTLVHTTSKSTQQMPDSEQKKVQQKLCALKRKAEKPRQVRTSKFQRKKLYKTQTFISDFLGKATRGLARNAAGSHARWCVREH